jgi:ubiquinone biosynthesis O-methyltransferase
VSVQDYDAWHRAHHAARADAHPSIVLQQWHRDALRLAPRLDDARVLEVGCGSGDFSLHLSRLAKTVTAVDFSPAAVEIARTRQSAHEADVEFRTADAEGLPFGDGEFDVVFSCECLEHLPDPQQALREMARVLRPGGHLVLTTENYSNATVVYWLMAWLRNQPFDSGAGVQPIEQFFLFWRVAQMVRSAGFALAGMHGAHFVFLVVPGTHPHLFVTKTIKTPALNWLLRPLARHVSFHAVKLPRKADSANN